MDEAAETGEALDLFMRDIRRYPLLTNRRRSTWPAGSSRATWRPRSG